LTKLATQTQSRKVSNSSAKENHIYIYFNQLWSLLKVESARMQPAADPLGSPGSDRAEVLGNNSPAHSWGLFTPAVGIISYKAQSPKC
jgi:hypothetical protein